ncbi:MAG: hypothetical protein RQ715_03025 [Methylococcales bacterium]|nr:hypothetical protein [Methylococcales bacterium]
MTEQKKDLFWVYVGGVAVALITVLLLVKMNENEKFEPIKEQIDSDLAQMNIRILN